MDLKSVGSVDELNLLIGLRLYNHVEGAGTAILDQYLQLCGAPLDWETNTSGRTFWDSTRILKLEQEV